jgi:hypothetical protein
LKSIDSASLPRNAQCLDPLLGCAGNFDHIDKAIRKVKRNRVIACLNARAGRQIDHAPDLAQAPAKLSARIVGNIPQHFAKLRPCRGDRREGQVGEKRAHLARSGQYHRKAMTADRHRAEHPHFDLKNRRLYRPNDQIPRSLPRRLPRSVPRIGVTVATVVTTRRGAELQFRRYREA